MEKDKVTYLQEEEIVNKAKQALQKFVEQGYAQNPIRARFSAFQKAKRKINYNDLI